MPKKHQDGLSPEEAELLVLHSAVNRADSIKGLQLVSNPNVQKMIAIVEKFIQSKRLVLYGGAAINLLLPKKDRFYNERQEIPDYDFYSDNAVKDSQELADIYAAAGYDVEARSGVHHGTYKVIANFIPIADVTQMAPELFRNIRKAAISVKVPNATLLAAPPDLLRMSMYLELSRPQGDTSRYEKVLKRLNVFNRNYPLEVASGCRKRGPAQTVLTAEQYNDVVDKLVEMKAVFFGAYALERYFKTDRSTIQLSPELPFDLLSNDAEATALKLQKHLVKMLGATGGKVVVVFHAPIGEVLPANYEVRVGSTPVALFYKPIACHNYNIVKVRRPGHAPVEMKIATIDTMFSFYFAFMFADKPYLNADRIRCAAHLLFSIQNDPEHRANKRGIFRRFNLSCIGRQETLESILLKKAQMYEKLKDDKKGDEYWSWFMKYQPEAGVKTRKAKLATPAKSEEHKQSFVVGDRKGGKRKRRMTQKRRSSKARRRTRKRT
jgi:hypothetical protein